MVRRWWRSLGFYWHVYLVMVVSFGVIVMLVEGLADPTITGFLEQRLHLRGEVGEAVIWLAGLLIPTLGVGLIVTHMIVGRMTTLVRLATRLSRGELSARIKTPGRAGDVFIQLSNAFNDMADSLERLFLHEKRLLADISHELRSPLARMRVAVDLLPLKREPEEREALAKVLESEIAQMDALVGMLLEEGRERLKGRNEFYSVSFSEFVSKCVASHSLAAENEGKEIHATIEPEVFVWGHPLRLRMLFENILVNALFYTPVKTRVDVRVWQTEKRVFLSVRDRGPGVPGGNVQDIFKAFFRVDESRARSSGGVGLGLTLAREAAVGMGGDIEARNVQPGLEITVTLPREGF